MADGEVVFAVVVSPRSSKNEIIGRTEGESPEVRLRVTAPPDEGKANKAVAELLAHELHVPKTAVRLQSGATSRHKRFSVGLSAQAFYAWYSALNVVE